MPNTDITQTTRTTTLATGVKDYSVPLKTTEGVSAAGETFYTNPNFTKWYGYYRKIPELKSAINALATWILGQGYEAEPHFSVILEHIKGWGEDTFNSILWNMLVTMKVNGDSYAEIIRDEETKTLINLKPLDPSSIITVCNPKGKIIRYEQTSKNPNSKPRKFEPDEIFHLCNDRIADEIHGISVIEAVQWVIDAKNEAMADWRRISHRSTIRILYVEEDNKTRLDNLKRDYKDVINKGELLILPIKRGEGEFVDLTLPPAEQFLAWIRYLENFFYQALGVPKVILGGTAENTEASAKVSVIVFDPTFIREITELEMDIWNQLGIKIKIKKQPSLMSEAQTNETKNTGQTGFQPNDVTAGAGK